MQIEKKWKKEFDKAAAGDRKDHQIALTSEEGFNAYRKYFFLYFEPYVQKNNSQTVLLDLGCGSGALSKELAVKGFKVCAVDYSSSVIEIAKKRAGGQRIDFQVADIFNLPFENNYFDIVICSGVFQCIGRPEEAVREIKRVLKNNGFLIITTLNCFSLAYLFRKEKFSLLKRYNPGQFKIILEKEGFNGIKLKGIYFFPKFLNFLTDFILGFKIYKLFNLFFPLFTFVSHSFYIAGKKEVNKKVL